VRVVYLYFLAYFMDFSICLSSLMVMPFRAKIVFVDVASAVGLHKF